MEINSVEECQIEDMPKIETKRRVTAMDTELSKDPLDENDPGYQMPEPKEENVSQPPKQAKKAKEGGDQPKKGKHAKIYNPDLEKKDDKDGDKKRRDRDT